MRFIARMCRQCNGSLIRAKDVLRCGTCGWPAAVPLNRDKRQQQAKPAAPKNEPAKAATTAAPAAQVARSEPLKQKAGK